MASAVPIGKLSLFRSRFHHGLPYVVRWLTGETRTGNVRVQLDFLYPSRLSEDEESSRSRSLPSTCIPVMHPVPSVSFRYLMGASGLNVVCLTKPFRPATLGWGQRHRLRIRVSGGRSESWVGNWRKGGNPILRLPRKGGWSVDGVALMVILDPVPCMETYI